VPAAGIGPDDAAEIASLLRFLARWLAADPDRLAVSLLDYADHPEYGIPQLRHDLNRLARLLNDTGDSDDTDPEPF
jgi:hypothetical protein